MKNTRRRRRTEEEMAAATQLVKRSGEESGNCFTLKQGNSRKSVQAPAKLQYGPCCTLPGMVSQDNTVRTIMHPLTPGSYSVTVADQRGMQ